MQIGELSELYNSVRTLPFSLEQVLHRLEIFIIMVAVLRLVVNGVALSRRELGKDLPSADRVSRYFRDPQCADGYITS